MSETLYVLMKVGFDYNDETYFRAGGGEPKLVFTSKEKAQKAAELKNIEKFKKIISNGDIREYGYSLGEVLSSSVTEEDLSHKDGIFMTLFGKSAEDWWGSTDWYGHKDFEFKIQPTEDQFIKLINCFSFTFWEVVTAKKG